MKTALILLVVLCSPGLMPVATAKTIELRPAAAAVDAPLDNGAAVVWVSFNDLVREARRQLGAATTSSTGAAADAKAHASAAQSSPDIWLRLLVGTGLVALQLRRKHRTLQRPLAD